MQLPVHIESGESFQFSMPFIHLTSHQAIAIQCSMKNHPEWKCNILTGIQLTDMMADQRTIVQTNMTSESSISLHTKGPCITETLDEEDVLDQQCHKVSTDTSNQSIYVNLSHTKMNGGQSIVTVTFSNRQS
jgi:hypothetical protein